MQRGLSARLVVCALLVGGNATAQHWSRWIDGLRPGTFPVLAVAQAPRRDVFYSFLQVSPDGMGAVWRGRIDDPTAPFTRMPSFPLPPPAAGMMPANVFSMTLNRRGEPVVGLSANGRSDNTAPMLMTLDEPSGRWITPPVTPAGNACGHNLYRVDRAPNGDLWGVCQWRGAYVSTDDGRSFRYVDVSALVRASHPAYFPTRAGATGDLGALYSVAFGADSEVLIGTETGGIVRSSDRGATWHPLDPDWANPASALAGVTNLGNVYGLAVLPDARLVVHGFIGRGPAPVPDAKRLYLVDRGARTFTVARGVPDYFLGGRMQFAVRPSGEVFLHSGHDTVDAMGAPTPGGIFASRNGLDWSLANAGIDEVFTVPGMSVRVDANGRGASGGFAVDGSDVYSATSSGRVYRLDADASTSADASVDAARDAVVSDVAASDVVARDAVVSDAALSDVAASDIVVRDVASDVAVSDVTVRDVVVSDVAVVDAASDVAVSDVVASDVAVSDVVVSDVGVPDVSVRDADRDDVEVAVDAGATAQPAAGCGCRAGAEGTTSRGMSRVALVVSALALWRARRRRTSFLRGDSRG